MTISKKIFNFKKSVDLIYIVHSEEYQDKFEKFEGHPINIGKVWKEIAEKLEVEKTKYKNVKDKYNTLYTKYKKEKLLISPSGSEGSSWKYFEIFNNSIPAKKKLFLEDVEELGVEKIIMPEEKPKKIVKTINKSNKVTKNELAEKKNKIYDLMISNFKKDGEINKMKKDIDDMKSMLLKKMKKFDEEKKGVKFFNYYQ